MAHPSAELNKSRRHDKVLLCFMVWALRQSVVEKHAANDLCCSHSETLAGTLYNLPTLQKASANPSCQQVGHAVRRQESTTKQAQPWRTTSSLHTSCLRPGGPRLSKDCPPTRITQAPCRGAAVLSVSFVMPW